MFYRDEKKKENTLSVGYFQLVKSLLILFINYNINMDFPSNVFDLIQKTNKIIRILPFL